MRARPWSEAWKCRRTLFSEKNQAGGSSMIRGEAIHARKDYMDIAVGGYKRHNAPCQNIVMPASNSCHLNRRRLHAQIISIPDRYCFALSLKCGVSVGSYRKLSNNAREERDRAANELQRLDAAPAALNGTKYGNRTGTHTLSAAARARIAAAQRKRWAKVRAAGKKA